MEARCLSRHGVAELEALVNRAVILSAGDQAGITVSDEEVEDEAGRIARSNGLSAQEWSRHLEKERGLTRREWLDDVVYPGLGLKRLGYGPETGSPFSS